MSFTNFEHWHQFFITQHDLRLLVPASAHTTDRTMFESPLRKLRTTHDHDSLRQTFTVEEGSLYPVIAQADNYAALSIHRRCLICRSHYGDDECSELYARNRSFCQQHVDAPLLCMAADENGMPCTFAMHYGCADADGKPMQIITTATDMLVFCPRHARTTAHSHDPHDDHMGPPRHDSDDSKFDDRQQKYNSVSSLFKSSTGTGSAESKDTVPSSSASSDSNPASGSRSHAINDVSAQHALHPTSNRLECDTSICCTFSDRDYHYSYTYDYPSDHDSSRRDSDSDETTVIELESEHGSTVDCCQAVKLVSDVNAADFQIIHPAVSCTPSPGSSRLVADDNGSAEFAYPFINQETNTVTLPSTTVKALQSAHELENILNLKFTVDEQREILAQCALFDSGAHSILLLTTINSLGMQIICPKLTLFSVKGFRSTDESTERLWGGTCYLPYLNQVTKDVVNYSMFGLVCPSTPVCIVGSPAVTRGLKLTLLENLDESIFKDIFSFLPSFAYSTDPITGLRSSRDAWLVGDSGKVWHRIICVYNKMVVAPAARESRVLQLLENAPAHVPMTSPLYLHVAPIAAMPVDTSMFIGPSDVPLFDRSETESSASTSTSLKALAGSDATNSNTDSLCDEVLADRLKSTASSAPGAHPHTLFRILAKLPKRDNRSRKQPKPPNAVGLLEQVMDLFSLLTMLHTNHMTLHGELSNSAKPLESALDHLADYYADNYNSDCHTVKSESRPDATVTQEHLQPLAELALASANKTFDIDYRLYSRVDHHLHSIPDHLMDYIGHLATCSGDIDSTKPRHHRHHNCSK